MLSMFAVSIATACLPLAEPQEYDVIVAGGGPAGIGAGYMAAKRGAKTLVLEKSGRLGGMGVSALVSPFSIATESPIVNHIAGRIGFSHSVDFHMADVRAFDLLKETGADVMLQCHLLRIGFPMYIGVRYARTNKPGDFSNATPATYDGKGSKNYCTLLLGISFD